MPDMTTVLWDQDVNFRVEAQTYSQKSHEFPIIISFYIYFKSEAK